jgi:hypothetical protein
MPQDDFTNVSHIATLALISVRRRDCDAHRFALLIVAL